MIRDVTSDRTSGLTSAVTISVWALLIAALSAVALGEIVDSGFFKHTESFHGPFTRESSETSHSFVVALGKHTRVGTLFNTSGDTSDDPYRSNLRLWINGQAAGPPHTIHEEIRKQGGGRYSHWGDTLLFSLLPDTANDTSTTVTVEYSPRLDTRIYTFGWLAVLLSAMSLTIRSSRLQPESLRRKRELLARSAAACCLGLYALVAVATALYLATIAVGLVQGYSLPNTAVFRLLPWTREFAMYEPAAHYFIVFVAMVGTVLSWLGPSAFLKNEATLIRYSNRYGLIVVAALFLFTLGATWCGIARPEDLQSNAMGGLVPLSDAHGYFELTFDQVITGHWTPLAEQRPFAAAHRTLLMFLAGYSNVRFLLLQALALACVTYAATRAVMNWRGLWSGLMFFGLTLALVRPYLITHLTEPLGLFWTLLGVPFVVRLLRRGSLVDGAVTFLAITLSLLTRMGSMFTIPAFAIWLVWAEARDAKRLKLTLVTLAAVLLGCSLVSATLLRLYGSGSGFVGSNFSFVVCGATHGGDWTTCRSLYRDELRKVGPTFGAAQAHYLYAKALEAFRRDPSVLSRRLIEGEELFLKNLVPVVLGGYTTPIIPRWFPGTAWTIIVGAGLVITLRRRRERSELSFWLFMWLGLVASAPLVIFGDGWRALSSVLPLVAVFVACGFATHADPSSSAPAGSGLSKLTLTATVVTMSLWIAIPGLAHWLDPLGARAFKTLAPKPGERIVLGSRHMAGFVVVPDDQPAPTDVPSMHRSDFTTAFQYSHHESYQRLTLPSLSTPFAFIVAPNANGTHGTLFVAPAEVLMRRDVAAWHFTLEEEIEEEEDVSFARVSTSTPMSPPSR